MWTTTPLPEEGPRYLEGPIIAYVASNTNTVMAKGPITAKGIEAITSGVFVCRYLCTWWFGVWKVRGR